jgi:MFS transporter, AAHS family, 3-hydroxyphenylpropionic acid transporter
MTTLSQNTPSATKRFLPVILCCLAAVCEGFDLQVPGLSAPLISEVFDMGPDDLGFFLSISTIGMMFGALIGGRLSDKIGRKWGLIGSITIYSLLTVATVKSTSVEMLFWLRFAAGFGLGGALPNIFSLAVESVSPARRSAAVGLVLAGPGIGGAIASLISAGTATTEQWTIIYYVGGLGPLLIVVPLLIIFLPNQAPAPEPGLVADTEASPSILTVLFGEGRAMRTLSVWLGLISILLVLYVLLSWLPTLLIDRGLSGSQASLVQTAVNLFAVPGSVLAGVVLDYILRRRLYLGLAGIFVGAMGAIILLATGPANIGVMLIGGALAGLLVIAGQTIIYALASISYPSAGRGTGVGAGVAMGRLGSAGGTLLTGYLVLFGLTSPQILIALLPVAVISGGTALYIMKSVGKGGSEE